MTRRENLQSIMVEHAKPFDAVFGAHGRVLDKKSWLDAEVIIAFSKTSKELTVIHGNDLLDEIEKTGETRPTRIMAIWHDPDTRELEEIFAACKAIKEAS